MFTITRRLLRLTHGGLSKVNNRIERLLNGRPAGRSRTPFITSLEEGYATGWETCPCVFVLSTGRVGTKTLTALLALSPDVVATHEPEPRLVKASFDAYVEGVDTAKSERWRDLVLASRDDFVLAACRRGRIYVETNNRLTYLAGALAVSFPASRFIHLHRHPYEVVRSAMRRGHYQGHNWDFARIRPRPGDPAAESWDGRPPLEKTAWSWMRVNADARRFLGTLPASRGLDLRADALFRGDEVALRRLFAFVGVGKPPKDEIEDVLAQKLNTQRSGTFPPPEEWREAERRAVRDTVAQVALSLGYET